MMKSTGDRCLWSYDRMWTDVDLSELQQKTTALKSLIMTHYRVADKDLKFQAYKEVPRHLLAYLYLLRTEIQMSWPLIAKAIGMSKQSTYKYFRKFGNDIENSESVRTEIEHLQVSYRNLAAA